MKRNLNKAFTLIELLAVIVILAIIALIATPIILGIVEDARKDSFLRSVELVVSTTDIDIANKTFEEMYTYEIVDGDISNLEIGVKNTEGMNGSITYDKQGNDVYALHNGVYCVIKNKDMDKAQIKDYVEGECELSGSPSGGILAAIQSKVPNENDVVTFTNGQLINLGEYGIRYQGSDPDNYIYFNCSDYNNQTSETCEVWRIIGVVDGKVKIIKNEDIGINSWNDQNGDCWDDPEDVNDWNNSTLKTYLNGEYLTSMITKNSATEEMISPSTWYLRGHNTSEVTKNEMYNLERTTGTIMYETPYIENTKIGLMYPSDFGFAAIETDTCTSSTTLSWNYEPCKSTNWIFYITGQEWTITADSDSTDAFKVYPTGAFVGESTITYPGYVRPVLYITSEIGLEGEGTPLSPYKLQTK